MPSMDRLMPFDYTIVQNVMKYMCLKKIYYESPFLKLAPNARDMMFDPLVPSKDLAPLSSFEIVATRDLDERLNSQGLLNEHAKRKSAFIDLSKLWNAENSMRTELELLRKDVRFRSNGFYLGIRKVIGLDATADTSLEKPFLRRDMERVAVRLEFFAQEMSDIKEKVVFEGPMVMLQPFLTAIAEELGHFGVGFGDTPLNLRRKHSAEHLS